MIDWWCAPDVDSPPLCWALLDDDGGCARWRGALPVERERGPAGPTARTVVRVDGRRVELHDGLVAVGDGVALVRLVRAVDGPVPLTHELRLPAGTWAGAQRAEGMPVDAAVRLVGGDSRAGGDEVTTSVTATAAWSGLAVLVGVAPSDQPAPGDLPALLEAAEAEEGTALAGARLPRAHPERALDALAVLRSCTFAPTGAVVAAVTTSLPEVPGGDRQFDYRYSWLRDAGLAVSVAALLGRREAAKGYLGFARGVWERHGGERVPPMTDVRGGPVPAEGEVPGVGGWATSAPVRVGNGAADQVQHDALGFLLEAVSVLLQSGASLDEPTWRMVQEIADLAASDGPGPSNGIWELRPARDLVSADLGRWLVLDRAVWIARGWRPWARRRRWKRAREEAARRVLSALGDDGRLPQTYGDAGVRPDAVALMVPVFGLLSRRDPRAHRIVDAVLADLGAGPHVYRYPPDGDDGFAAGEGTFVAVSCWAVSALAALGRVDEAAARLDQLCAELPALIPEELDPATGRGLGNVPLVWAHAELARALYVLEAARIRARWGGAVLWAWRLARYASLRWGTP